MKFKSDRQRKAVMANLNKGNRTTSFNIPVVDKPKPLKIVKPSKQDSIKWDTKYNKEGSEVVQIKINKDRKNVYNTKTNKIANRHAEITVIKIYNNEYGVIGKVYEEKNGLLLSDLKSNYSTHRTLMSAQKKVNKLRENYDKVV